MDAEKIRLNVPSKGFPMLHFARSETNGWEIAAKAMGNVPVPNLQAGPECHRLSGLRRHLTVNRCGAGDTGFMLLPALGQEEPKGELNIFPLRVKPNLKPSHLIVNLMDIP